MSEPNYQNALIVAEARPKLAAQAAKANASLTPAERRQAFAKADADYVAARARLNRLYPPRGGLFDDHDLRS
jgi:hypothetical protein